MNNKRVPERRFRNGSTLFAAGVLLAAVLLCASVVHAEVAVLPYRIENPSSELDRTRGIEYGKIMGVMIALTKGLEVASPRDVERDMGGFSLSPGDIITRENLAAMGKARYLDLVVVGSLSRSGSVYRAESRLYSVRENKVVSRSRVEARDLFECVRRDAEELFFTYPDRPLIASGGKGIEVAVLLDTSYAMSHEWSGVRRGIMNMADRLSDSWEDPLKIHLVPFSKQQERMKKTTATSPVGIRNGISGLHLKGGCDGKDLDRAFEYAVRALAWGRGNRALIIVIVNSPVGNARAAERLALTAAKKGMRICVVSLGKQGPDDRSILRQVAVIGRGIFREVSYRQKVFDLRGKTTDLFMEGGRFFYARDMDDRWKDGLFQAYGRGDSRRQKPRAYLSEIHYDETRYMVSPYTMARSYPELTDRKIVNSSSLENNTDALLNDVGRRFGADGPSGDRSFSGKALLTDGEISLWVRVRRREDLEFFVNKKALGQFFTLGVSVIHRPGDPYGISFNPGYFITTLGPDFIPESTSTSLEKIIKNPGFYMENGILRPPLWFVRVKVAETRSEGGLVDIRDER